MMQSGGNALAVALWPSSANRMVRNVALVVLGTVILAISAKIKVPFWPVPMTLQTFAVMAIAAAYGSRLGVITVLAYFAEAMVGLPVFTNTPPAIAGPAYFLGPTGGFLAGFVAAAWIVGLAADRGWSRSIPKLAAAMVAADVVVFALGFAWLAFFAAVPNMTGIGMAKAFAGGVSPFILGDIVKIALAACAVPAVWHLVGRKA